MKILITGAAGRLGSQLVAQLQEEHFVLGADIVGEVSHILDIADYDACRRLVADTNPDIVLHPAAWTDVNGCALNPRKALTNQRPRDGEPGRGYRAMRHSNSLCQQQRGLRRGA